MQKLFKGLGLALTAGACLVAFQNCGSSKSARGEAANEASGTGSPVIPKNPLETPNVPDPSCADSLRPATPTTCLTPAAENQVNSGQCLKQFDAATVATCATQCGADRASGYSFATGADAGYSFCYCVYGATQLQPTSAQAGDTGFQFQSNACR